MMMMMMMAMVMTMMIIQDGDDDDDGGDDVDNLGMTNLNQEGPYKNPEAQPGFASGASGYFRKLL